jgi:chromosome segregation ATPase
MSISFSDAEIEQMIQALETVKDQVIAREASSNKLREERNMYRAQLRQVNRAQRIAKLELKELKLKYDLLLETKTKEIVDAENRIINMYTDAIAACDAR